MADQQQGAPAAPDAAQQNSASATQQPANTPADTRGEDTEARFNSAVAAARREEREKIKREQDAAEAKRKQDELAAQGQFEAVATQLRSEVATLTTERDSVQSSYQALADVVSRIVKDRLADLPAELRSLHDAEAPVHKQLEWLERAAKAAAKLNGNPTPPGNGAVPRPVGGDVDKAARESQAALYRN